MQNRRSAFENMAQTAHARAHETALVQAWCQRTGDALSPLQARVLAEDALFADVNLVVVGDAGEGLEFIRELSAVATVGRGASAVLVAADDEDALDVHAQLAAARHRVPGSSATLQVRLSTRHHAADDGALAARDFDIAVCSAHKLRALLARDPGLLDDVGLLVIEELDQLADATAGPTLDVVLTHARQRSAARLIGFSRAAVDIGLTAARWLRARVLGRDGWMSSESARFSPETRGRERAFEATSLHSVAAQLATTKSDLRRVALTSFHGYVEVSRLTASARLAGERAAFDEALLAARKRCERAGLLRTTPRRVVCTRRGLACATLGLDLETAKSDAVAASGSTLELLTELCLSPAGRALAERGELRDDRDPGELRGELLRLAADAGVAARPVFRWLLEDLGALEPKAASALTCALTLLAWCDGEDPRQLATRRRTTLPGLRALVRALGWLAAARLAFAELDGAERSAAATRALHQLAPGSAEGTRALLARRVDPRGARRPPRRRTTTAPLPPPAFAPARTRPSKRPPHAAPASAARSVAVTSASKSAPAPAPAQKTPRWSPYGVIWVA